MGERIEISTRSAAAGGGLQVMTHHHGDRRTVLSVTEDRLRVQLTTLPSGAQVQLTASQLRWLAVVSGPAALQLLEEEG